MKLYFLMILLCAGELFVPACGYGANKTGEDQDQKKEMYGYIEQAEQLPNSEPQKAIALANKVIAYAMLVQDQELLARAGLVNGHAYGNYGDFVTSFEYLQKAQEHCPAENKRLSGEILLRLSRSYVYLRELNRAFELANQALDISNVLQDSVLIATCYNMIGLINIYVPDMEMAEVNFLKALEINRKIDDKRGIVRNLNNLALYKGDTGKKIAQLEEAIAINKGLDANWSLGENYNNLGRQCYFDRKYEKSLQALSTARGYAEKIRAKELIQDNNRYFADTYSAWGKYREAYPYLRAVLEEIEREKMAEQMRVYETSVLQKRLDTTRQSIREKEQEYSLTKMRYAILIVVLTFVTIFIVAAYFVFRSRQRRRIQILEARGSIQAQQRMIIEKEREVALLSLQQKEIQAQNTGRELQFIRDELTNTAFFVRTRGELLSSIQNQIRETYKLPEEQKLEKLHAISRMISQMNSKNSEIDMQVDKISREFIFKLSEKYPLLTDNEKRLASLLRIGLSTKEIASIIGSQPKTVDMARYRLRKKMELDSDEGLQECLSRL